MQHNPILVCSEENHDLKYKTQDFCLL